MFGLQDVTQTLMAAAQAGSVMGAASRVKVADGINPSPDLMEPRPLLAPPKADHSEEEHEGPRDALHKAGHGLVTRTADVLSDIVSSIPLAWRSAQQRERSPASPVADDASLRLVPVLLICFLFDCIPRDSNAYLLPF
jgi:hypothetical protein